MNAKASLALVAKQEKQFDALYRSAGAIFGLPDCSMWVLYYLTISPTPLSQQDLIEKMIFPKQTVNSAVISLQKKGLLTLEAIPGTRNRKKLILTQAGRELSDRTVGKMYQAECRAVERIGQERIEQYIVLYQDFFAALKNEFQKEGLTNEAHN